MQLQHFFAACALCACTAFSPLFAQENKPTPPPAPVKWYDKFTMRGYAQMRYNRLLETNENLKCEQCDKSIGKGQGFAFRRARLVFSGHATEKLFVYIQFDYSSDASSTAKHFLQVRDAYFDYYLDPKNDFRVRVGQSKVPFGFENMQSSSNRLPFDRADALNSAIPNERDLGVTLFYTPKNVRDRFKMLAENGYKHTGDYGLAALGIYNGQTANKPEQNDQVHAVGRITYPFKIRNQIFEPGIQAYTGKYTVPAEQLVNKPKIVADQTYLDQRIAGSIAWYAHPIGLLAEYNIGKSPAFNPATDSIEIRNLKGGFLTVSYRKHLKKQGELQPYYRYQLYHGAKKHETDARHHHVEEHEIGIEWQVNKAVEITTAYVISNRQTEDLKVKNYHEKGNFLRLQVQYNY